MTKNAKKSKLEQMLDWVRETGKDGVYVGTTRKVYAGLRDGLLRVQSYNDSEELTDDYYLNSLGQRLYIF